MIRASVSELRLTENAENEEFEVSSVIVLVFFFFFFCRSKLKELPNIPTDSTYQHPVGVVPNYGNSFQEKKKMKPAIKVLLVVIALLILLVLVSTLSFLDVVRRVKLADHTEYSRVHKASQIPNVIYTYWNTSTLSPFVRVCVASWRRHNPEYKIVVLNPQNLCHYGLETILQLPYANNHQRTADFVRCSILKTRGGIWLDASIYLNRSLGWVHWYQQEFDSEFVGYSIKSCGKAKRNPTSAPIVENWFMACIPNSRFVSDWHDRFMTINEYTNVDRYVESIQASTDLSGISSPRYLTMHIAALSILQESHYPISLLPAENGPLLYLHCMSWNHVYFWLFVLWFKGREAPLIKYRGYERAYMEFLRLERVFDQNETHSCPGCG